MEDFTNNKIELSTERALLIDTWKHHHGQRYRTDSNETIEADDYLKEQVDNYGKMLKELGVSIARQREALDLKPELDTPSKKPKVPEYVEPDWEEIEREQDDKWAEMRSAMPSSYFGNGNGGLYDDDNMDQGY
ncbi:hypothetical protein [Pseudolactococcus insecticola]|uniref:Uncharacterized protein n=1 Tax=Pseudolactococcus insecticola TaxID=2709158 RepID=A0A6A0B7S6_9LACT|nr:hypothetical protein [Lactococcus insecticola]GFH41390.1 hypothetical protein Hs20B_17880 [Lactococcus insecticola]